MEITCYRDREILREQRWLPAEAYNLAHTLLACSLSGCLFVPIRAIQYLAIIDAEEIIFLDSEHKAWVEIAWQNFRPHQRNSLSDPVEYDLVYYNPSAAETMRRLPGEFPRALHSLADKAIPATPARVIKLRR